MMVQGKHYRTVWIENETVKMINQKILPYKFEISSLKNHKETASAIKDMTVRGAPAIGAAAAYAMLQACYEAPENDFMKYIIKASETIKATRPTAYDLFFAVDKILSTISDSSSKKGAVSSALKIANEISDSSVEQCKKIGEFGNTLLTENPRISTHCNAGWLACVDWGTALSPIYAAKRSGKKPFVFVDETRPRLQGAKLTAWELLNEGISHAVIVDNAIGHFMQRGEIDIVIVGTDRVASNGDFANKIGTYSSAVCAKENGIPFYVAAPLSTFDLNCESGKEIPIEERNENEIKYVSGLNKNNEIEEVLICPEKSSVRNPSFDVTPNKFVTGFITPKGIIKPNTREIKSLFKQL
ncbi:MAG: S-methyl-5-thioribose-1-phosphate isomerase [Candidatus Diapherotrites archaeon]